MYIKYHTNMNKYSCKYEQDMNISTPYLRVLILISLFSSFPYFLPMTQQTQKQSRFAATTLAPVGVSSR